MHKPGLTGQAKNRGMGQPAAERGHPAMPTLAQLDAAADLVHEVMPPTPEIAWPLLAARVGAEIWVKHENHTPIGAFKLRGGLVYMADLRKSEPAIQGVI